MQIVQWQMSPDQMAEFGTSMSHITLNYLLHEKIITEKQHEQLVSSIMITAVRNNKSMGQRILKRLFKIEDKPNDYTFVIVSLADKMPYQSELEKDKE